MDILHKLLTRVRPIFLQATPLQLCISSRARFGVRLIVFDNNEMVNNVKHFLELNPFAYASLFYSLSLFVCCPSRVMGPSARPPLRLHNPSPGILLEVK